MRFEIYACTESADINPRRTWEFVANRKTLKSAKTRALLTSCKLKWHEVELKGFDKYEDIIYHLYYRNGKLEIDMCV